jgi:hypothetical protein
MCFSCHVKTYIHPFCYSSKRAWHSVFCSFSFVIITQVYLHAKNSCFRVSSFGNFHYDYISGNGYLLLTNSNACTIPEKHGTFTPVTQYIIQNKQIRKTFDNKIPEKYSTVSAHPFHKNGRCVSLDLYT